MRQDEGLRRIHWYGDWTRDLMSRREHAIFLRGDDDNDTLELGEPVAITCGPEENPTHLGLAEVVRKSRCRIVDLLEEDFQMNGAVSTPRETVLWMREAYPELEEVNLSTEVEVLRLRRHTYDLNELKARPTTKRRPRLVKRRW